MTSLQELPRWQMAMQGTSLASAVMYLITTENNHFEIQAGGSCSQGDKVGLVPQSSLLPATAAAGQTLKQPAKLDHPPPGPAQHPSTRTTARV
jgi:hypothetical protein